MRELSERLLLWYDNNKRALPWRLDQEPYHVWLSEIMLQQTRAEAVKTYYLRFLSAWPAIDALSSADIGEVLKAWEGLGYYSRARNLHKTARIITEEYGGQFPKSPEELQRLPGIGPYTAAAIASICYGVPVPAIDGNQARILSRLTARAEPLLSPQDLFPEAAEYLSSTRPGDQNQAYMDLANAVCLARNPLCDICPLSTECLAREEGRPDAYPIRMPHAAKKKELLTVAVVTNEQSCVYVKQRDTRGLLGGLYAFPLFQGDLTPEQTFELLENSGFDEIQFRNPLPSARHVFTHKVWIMKGYHFTAVTKSKEWECIADFSLTAFPGALRVYRECAEMLLAEGSNNDREKKLP